MTLAHSPSGNHLSLSRRAFLRGGTMAAAAAVTTAAHAEYQRVRPTLFTYEDYGWLRGFNMVPSWGTRIEEAWSAYDGARMREEVALARQVHANCIRLWIDYSAWKRDPDKITAHFLDAVAAIDEAGMKTMPCLFNRWHDAQHDYGGTYMEDLQGDLSPRLEYVSALVTPLVRDARVLIWDLCNEPQAAADSVKVERDWLSAVALTVRECSPQHPITIGTADAAGAKAFADITDVLCGHPYAPDQAGLKTLITSYRALQKKHKQPFLVNACIPGSLDDGKQAEVVKFYTEMLAASGMGWMGRSLRDHASGIHGEGNHAFFTKEGKLRPGLEFLTEKPKRVGPWLPGGSGY